jgi:hypothetical protein
MQKSQYLEAVGNVAEAVARIKLKGKSGASEEGAGKQTTNNKANATRS